MYLVLRVITPRSPPIFRHMPEGATVRQRDACESPSAVIHAPHIAPFSDKLLNSSFFHISFLTLTFSPLTIVQLHIVALVDSERESISNLQSPISNLQYRVRGRRCGYGLLSTPCRRSDAGGDCG